MVKPKVYLFTLGENGRLYDKGRMDKLDPVLMEKMQILRTEAFPDMDSSFMKHNEDQLEKYFKKLSDDPDERARVHFKTFVLGDKHAKRWNVYVDPTVGTTHKLVGYAGIGEFPTEHGETSISNFHVHGQYLDNYERILDHVVKSCRDLSLHPTMITSSPIGVKLPKRVGCMFLTEKKGVVHMYEHDPNGLKETKANLKTKSKKCRFRETV